MQERSSTIFLSFLFVLFWKRQQKSTQKNSVLEWSERGRVRTFPITHSTLAHSLKGAADTGSSPHAPFPVVLLLSQSAFTAKTSAVFPGWALPPRPPSVNWSPRGSGLLRRSRLPKLVSRTLLLIKLCCDAGEESPFLRRVVICCPDS